MRIEIPLETCATGLYKHLQAFVKEKTKNFFSNQFVNRFERSRNPYCFQAVNKKSRWHLSSSFF
jgi:hypothetical protein